MQGVVPALYKIVPTFYILLLILGLGMCAEIDSKTTKSDLELYRTDKSSFQANNLCPIMDFNNRGGASSRERGEATMSKPEIIEMFDFKNVSIPDKLLEIKVPEAAVDQALHQVAKRYLTISRTDGPVQKGDIVIVDMQSGDTAWQREGEHINVGLGFSEPILEESLLGMYTGGEKSLSIKDSCVAIRVRSICRLTVPVLTDEHVQALGIDGVNTVEDYRAYVTENLLEKAKLEKLNALIPYVIKQIAEQSQFRIPEDALQAQYDDLLCSIRRFTRVDEHTPEEEYLPAFCAKQFHKNIKTVEEAEHALRDLALEQVKQSAMALRFVEDAGKKFDESTYEAYLKDLSEMVGEPVETLREAAPYEAYLEKAPQLFMRDLLVDYYRNKFTVVNN